VKTETGIAILGSTGSIGRSSLEVIARFPGRFAVRYLTAHRNLALLQEQIRRVRPRGVVVFEEANASKVRAFVNGTVEVLSGEEGLREVVSREDVDVVISSLVGFAGLKPTLWGLEAGKRIALANKETLVVGGELIMNLVRARGLELLPVDSEHSAILQCLQGEEIGSVKRLLLTASGGPFLNVPKSSFDSLTPEQALNHPTWSMGNKITIDSATLMNKGLEVIEAHWLFGLPADRIDVVIHPQSIVHSMVEFADGSVKAQLGAPDMKLPIQYALTFPERPASMYTRLDISALSTLTFHEPDLEKFRCLALAYEALSAGGTAPAVLNAANEVAVGLFLERRIPFSAIPVLLEEALGAHHVRREATLEDLVEVDRETREFVRNSIGVSWRS
jgi:1-deoxy-D-xylulose-5-phosphate reductoisomerase